MPEEQHSLTIEPPRCGLIMSVYRLRSVPSTVKAKLRERSCCFLPPALCAVGFDPEDVVLQIMFRSFIATLSVGGQGDHNLRNYNLHGVVGSHAKNWR